MQLFKAWWGGYLLLFVIVVIVVGEVGFVKGLANGNNNFGKFSQQQQNQKLHLPQSSLSVSSVFESSRRSLLVEASLIGLGLSLLQPQPAKAAADCFKDCMKSCKVIAPKDPEYCTANCKGYCEQDDRADGLSGSASAENGEVGILGGAWGQGTVPKGEDKPPTISLPGLDFSSEKGKKLIGY